jgi:hypothetical protein
VIAGFWTHADLISDRFSFQDLIDANDLLAWKEENQKIAHDWVDSQRPKATHE